VNSLQIQVELYCEGASIHHTFAKPDATNRIGFDSGGLRHLHCGKMHSTMIGSSTLPIGATLVSEPPVSAGSYRTFDKLALVIPTLCEAENIAALLNHVRSVLDPLRMDYEILVVDDDSCDGTGAVVLRIARMDPRVRLLVRKGERGLSGAILHGWQHTDAAVLGVMDADLQHPPELLPQLLSAIREGQDLAIGSRYAPGGDLGQWNPIRRFLSAAAVWVTWPLQRAQAKASDPMSGFFMVRRRCLPDSGMQKSGFKLLLEILVRGRIRSVREVPISFGLRYRGASKANFKVAWDYGRLLAGLYLGKMGLGPHAS
jgi:dolichol-phosphate mannosyltransferase